jgi:4'-phosphopantetheinyl transferase EntD
MKLKIISVEPRTDGSGQVALDVEAYTDEDVVIPGAHATVLLNAADVDVALALPTAAQRAAALKALITAAVAEFKANYLAVKVAANTAAATTSDALNAAYTLPVMITL